MLYAQKEYEALLQSFIGETISQVIYYEYHFSKFAFERFNKPFHDLHGGLNIVMESSRILGITWGKRFAHFDIELTEGALQYDELYPDYYAYDVTNHSLWGKYINKKIDNITSHWQERIDYVQEANIYLPTYKHHWLFKTLYYLRNKFSNTLPTSDVTPDSLTVANTTYPQDIIISFDDLNLYISASMYEPDCDCFIPSMDNLTLIFDDMTAKQYLLTLFK